MNKKTKKWIIITTFLSAILFFLIVFFWFWLKREENLNKNSLGKEWARISEEPEVKKTWHSHKKNAKLEKIKPDNKKTELTVRYQRSNSLLKGSSEIYAIFWPTNMDNAFEIAIVRDHPQLQGKIKNTYESGFEEKRKFKLSFFNKDLQEIQENWTGGRKWKCFKKGNKNLQVEPLPYQWENSQPLNPAFLGKWKIDLRKSVESGFAKINSKIRRRIEEQLSRNPYDNPKNTNKSPLEIEIKKEKNGLAQILGGSRYTIFWIKNLDDYTMACFTDYHPNHSFDVMEDDAILTIFRLDKIQKNLTVFHPTIVEDVCRSIGVDGEKIIGWVPFSYNREYQRLKPYFRENARIIATKIN